MYDFIGDIHGHADKLEALLTKLGYKIQGGVYQHPTRKAFFLGDFIDRGPKIRQVLNIVMSMLEKGSALSVMGNHEYNYLSFHTETKSGGGYLRPRDEKNQHQCKETITQLSDSENQRLLGWVWTLPLWFETNSFRAIHACWDDSSIEAIKKMTFDSKMNLDFLHESAKNKSPAYHAIETLLKGKETDLPPELHFKDKDQTKRTEARICWWDTSRKIILPESNIDDEVLAFHMNEIKVEEEKILKPTFFGHYWESGTPQIVNPKAVCLDYSVAKENGKLCAYRFDDEPILETSKLVWV